MANIANLALAITEGTYQVDPVDLADNLMAYMMELYRLTNRKGAGEMLRCAETKRCKWKGAMAAGTPPGLGG